MRPSSTTFVSGRLGGVDHLYEAKMLILGEGGAGKTSLLRRLYQPDQPLPTESETTRGISIYRHEFKLKNGRRFRLNVWDFGGQEIYHATHQFFLTHRSLYVLVDDTRKDYKSVSDEGFKYWLELIDVFGGHSPTLIFQNEKGGRSKAIDIAGIKRPLRQREGTAMPAIWSEPMQPTDCAKASSFSPVISAISARNCPPAGSRCGQTSRTAPRGAVRPGTGVLRDLPPAHGV